MSVEVIDVPELDDDEIVILTLDESGDIQYHSGVINDAKNLPPNVISTLDQLSAHIRDNQTDEQYPFE